MHLDARTDLSSPRVAESMYEHWTTAVGTLVALESLRGLLAMIKGGSVLACWPYLVHGWECVGLLAIPGIRVYLV